MTETQTQTQTQTQIELAEKVLRPAIEYPSAFDECREAWLELMAAPDDETDYITTITTHVRIVERYDIEMDDRSNLIIAAFWAASAEKVLNNRQADAEESEAAIRKALENVWAEVA